MSQHLDENIIQSLKELSSEDEPHFFTDYLKEFLKPIPQRIQSMSEAIQKTDHKALAAAAHALKSSSANTGALKMADLCQKLEELGKAGTVTGAQKLFDELREESRQVTEEIQTLPEFKALK